MGVCMLYHIRVLENVAFVVASLFFFSGSHFRGKLISKAKLN